MHCLKLHSSTHSPTFLQQWRCICCSRPTSDSFDLFDESSEASSFTFVSLLRHCIHTRSLSPGKSVHARIIQTQKTTEQLLSNTLLDMYLKCGSISEARRVFDEMPERDVCSWTLIISGYARNGPAEEALNLFQKMELSQISPNSFTFATVVSACANLASIERGMEIHEAIIRRGLHSTVSVTNALIDMYGKCGEWEKARQLFDKMPNPNVISWTSLIGAYAHNELINEALDTFHRMPERDPHAWSAIIVGLFRNRLVDEAARLFRISPYKDTFSWNLMVAGLAQNGFVHEALRIFEEMPNRVKVSWNAIISGLVQNGFDEKALDLFDQMLQKGVEPDSKTFASVLPACANLAMLEKGIEIQQEINRRGLGSDLFVMSALIDMYAKCGCLEKARDMFDKMQRKDVVSWTSMITGYSAHGRAESALELFQQMIRSGFRPTSVTLLSILSACSHAGMVEEGYRYFYSMHECYGIRPCLEHYRCMTDLLCRAGMLNEAHRFITEMPMKPDAAVWGCLLSACRLHNNVELGECAAEHIIELDPSISSAYVLLSIIYGNAGRWGDVSRVRKMMKEREVVKSPAFSWIEVANQVHGFLGGDGALSET